MHILKLPELECGVVGTTQGGRKEARNFNGTFILRAKEAFPETRGYFNFICEILRAHAPSARPPPVPTFLVQLLLSNLPVPDYVKSQCLAEHWRRVQSPSCLFKNALNLQFFLTIFLLELHFASLSIDPPRSAYLISTIGRFSALMLLLKNSYCMDIIPRHSGVADVGYLQGAPLRAPADYRPRRDPPTVK